jgi:hypothetical protein
MYREQMVVKFPKVIDLNPEREGRERKPKVTNLLHVEVAVLVVVAEEEEAELL